MPLGILAPTSRYLPGFFRKSTTSMSSAFSSSRPATSANVVFSPLTCLALDLANWKALPFPAPFIMMYRRKIIAPIIRTFGIRLSQNDPVSGLVLEYTSLPSLAIGKKYSSSSMATS